MARPSPARLVPGRAERGHVASGPCKAQAARREPRRRKRCTSLSTTSSSNRSKTRDSRSPVFWSGHVSPTRECLQNHEVDTQDDGAATGWRVWGSRTGLARVAHGCMAMTTGCESWLRQRPPSRSGPATGATRCWPECWATWASRHLRWGASWPSSTSSLTRCARGWPALTIRPFGSGLRTCAASTCRRPPTPCPPGAEVAVQAVAGGTCWRRRRRPSNRGRLSPWARRGSRASRIPSPRRLKPRTVRLMANPGMITTWGSERK